MGVGVSGCGFQWDVVGTLICIFRAGGLGSLFVSGEIKFVISWTMLYCVGYVETIAILAVLYISGTDANVGTILRRPLLSLFLLSSYAKQRAGRSYIRPC